VKDMSAGRSPCLAFGHSRVRPEALLTSLLSHVEESRLASFCFPELLQPFPRNVPRPPLQPLIKASTWERQCLDSDRRRFLPSSR
jgi:hypothetical protein